MPGGQPISRRRAAWTLAAICGALLLFQAWLIFVQPHGTPTVDSRDVRAVGEIAGGVAVRQTLLVRAAGLDAVTLHVQASGNEHEGPVILELGEAGQDPAGGDDRPLYRSLFPAKRVVDDPTFTWRFAPIEASSGKQYAVRVSMPSAPFGHGLTLLATRDEGYLDGRLWFDGREQWGDLLFDTSAQRATSFARLEHALRDKPRWLRSRVTLALLFLAYNACLAVVFWTLLTAPLTNEDAERALDKGQPRSASWSRQRTYAAGALLLVCAAAAWWWIPRRVSIERGARLLLEEFPGTQKRTTMPSLQQGFVYQDVWWKGRRMKCVAALPSSRIVWPVDVRPDQELRGWYGLREDVWNGPGDGAQFRLGISDSQVYREHVRRWLRPVDDPLDRTYLPLRVDLRQYAGRRVEVILNTEPGPMGNAVGDAAMWCEVRVVERR